MYVLVLALLGAMLMVTNIATTTPQQMVLQESARSSAVATNFWAYQQAAAVYAYNNPTFTGDIPDASLVFPQGYVPMGLWKSTVSVTEAPTLTAGQLFTYSLAPVSSSAATEIAKFGGNSYFIGVAFDGWYSGAYTRAMNFLSSGVSMTVTSYPWNQVPAAVPVGSVVVIGS